MKTVRIRQWLRYAILTLFAAGALAGCAQLDEVVEIKPAPPAAPERKPAPKEYGSLWSEDSSWNYVYAASAARMAGDIVTLRLDDSFKRRVTRMRDSGREKPERSVASESDDRSSDLTMKATIEEVTPRGIYRIKAADSLRLGDWQPYLVMSGRVRDRDINVDDEVRIADVVDLNLDITQGPAVSGEARKGSDNVSW